MKVQSSDYLSGLKPVLQKLLQALLRQYDYASVLAADVDAKDYSVSARGMNVSENDHFGKRGFVVRVHAGGGYAEYSANALTEEEIPAVLQCIDQELQNAAAFQRYETPKAADEPLSFERSTDYEINPKDLGDAAILEKMTTDDFDAMMEEAISIQPLSEE